MEYIISKMENCSQTNYPDMLGDCKKFGELYNKRTGKHFQGKIDRQFIRQMVIDELDELDEAKDEAEEVDALLDATYYILHHLSGTGLDIQPIWNRIHLANMTKFGPGCKMLPNGKWAKPSSFLSPEDDIREEIKRQRLNSESI